MSRPYLSNVLEHTSVPANINIAINLIGVPVQRVFHDGQILSSSDITTPNPPILVRYLLQVLMELPPFLIYGLRNVITILQLMVDIALS